MVDDSIDTVDGSVNLSDGGCAGVVNDGVADAGGDGRLVVWVLESMHGVIFALFIKSKCSVGSVWRAAH